MIEDMRQYIQKLHQSDGLRQSLITVVGNTLATGLSAIALILISRMLGPVQFGEFSVGFAIIMILNRLNDFGLNTTITKFASRSAQDQESVQNIFGYTLKVKLVFSIILIVTGLIVTPFLVQLLHFQQPILIY